jgi:succinate dehydrogenase hydrophobic anchor subunit
MSLRKRERAKRVLKRAALYVSAVLGVILAVYVLYRLSPDVGGSVELDQDKAAILFGAATLVLTFVTILVALLAVFGWISIREKIESDIDDYIKTEGSQELLGIARVMVGSVYGRLAAFERGEIDASLWPDYLLDNAILATRLGCDTLDDSEIKWKADNNLAYYLALKGGVNQRREALRLAEACRRQYSGKVADPNLILTYARVYFAFGLETDQRTRRDLERLKEALRAVRELKDQPLSGQQQFELARLEKMGEAEIQKAETAGEPKAQPTIRSVIRDAVSIAGRAYAKIVRS